MRTLQTMAQVEKASWLLITSGCHLLEDAYQEGNAKLLVSLLNLSDSYRVSGRLMAKLR